MQQNIILTIQDHFDHLPGSEQKVAEYILKHTNEVINLSAQELAKKAGSSPAAIIRFCRSIEVSGFTDLKLLLSANIGSVDTQMYTEVENGETTAAIKEKLQHRLIHVLERTNEHLDDQAIDQAVRDLEVADIIFVYGLGASSLVAQDIYQKFTRLGLSVFFTMDHHLFASAIGTNRLKGIFIGISNSGSNQETNALADLAIKKGWTVIGLTANADSELAQKSTLLLLTPVGGEAPLRSAATVSLTAQLYVVDVLFFAYAAKNYDETLEKIKHSRGAVEIVKKELK
ncbi:MurR/RpiR family transcriptional regulator [Enterococcus caccae]|uniref:RpiR family phosphosugar-binding transcriptional regulator n=1 Tax=Enterococcus caccae ATCC BAA-1240 TaxID=1158612 RepID=R3TQ84_9ENTE|nr:MurR/RpiR family transcriptional regulator [Enterococcus caccae]EOL43273.1 RpiR family phosphosugar-binding transcriptional regulator [Enterococcus caccae ATCC BAA-1240]EOT68327.1 RpiR family phosphosugar-binding transcriptional regulator [Enterococcus caccae ATCC BAA-1240]OJG26814.1 RpiR family phosphosugar-binding transcriptional regulator [Enterococcus caccae]